MKILTDSIPKDVVLTIGKFEGVHLGHQKLIGAVVKKAKELDKKSAIIVFEPHPYVFFGTSDQRLLLTDLERNHLLQGLGIDYILQFTFDANFAALTPEQFCRIIFENCKNVYVGEDYKFGNNRSGDVLFLRQEAKKYNATVDIISLQDSISTSNIRSLISEGKIQETNSLLGFNYFSLGQTKQGKQLGRTIGFPTLNIYPPKDKLLPPNGVYQTITTVNDQIYKSITNIGLRPTVENVTTPAIETHLLDYKKNEELYNKFIKVEFTRFVRPEIKFASVDELIKQITEDIKKLC